MEGLIHPVEQFDAWRSGLCSSLRQLRLWLRRNEMFSADADLRIQQVLEALELDYLTVAFAGEFSRGKTELINALFFSEFGQRVLPSEAGRTTMCPTELFFDRASQQTYLRLLPIETRTENTSLDQFKNSPDRWQEFPLRTSSVGDMTASLAHITETRRVSQAEAVRLGFAKHHSSDIDAQGRVEIPVWRHAMISFPHPILKKGLKILDTPGLNALGSEPELTLNLLPQCQAVIFVLAADAGVTASDMAIWEEFIHPIRDKAHLGLFVVLNKIDVLWDELSNEQQMEKSLQRVIQTTARQLNLDVSNILPISARKGLVARVQQNSQLLAESRLEALEEVLATTMLNNKRDLYWQRLLQDATDLVEQGKQNLYARHQQLQQQHKQLSGVSEAKSISVDELVSKVEREQEELKLRVLGLLPSRRLLERQARSLLNCLGPRQLERMLVVTRQRLVEARTTLGIFGTMSQFNQNVEAMFDEFCREAELANKMAEAVYRKYEQTYGVEFMSPRLLEAKRYRRELLRLMRQGKTLNKLVSRALTEQSTLVRRFFSVHVASVAQFLSQIRRAVSQWNRRLLYPLEQQVSSRKRLLEQHLEQLRDIQRLRATTGGQLRALSNLMGEVDDEIANADRTLAKLHCPPQQYAQHDTHSNVVAMQKARRTP